MVSESTLTLDILPLSADTARLVRVYGTEPCIALPGTLPAPEGGSFAVTELGDYCFSEKPRSLPAADKTCRYEAAPDGTARLIRAFGQTVGGTCRRYDFDFDAPAAGSDADDLHPDGLQRKAVQKHIAAYGQAARAHGEQTQLAAVVECAAADAL